MLTFCWFCSCWVATVRLNTIEMFNEWTTQDQTFLSIFYIAPINDHPWTRAAIFSHTISLFTHCCRITFVPLNKCVFSVEMAMKSSMMMCDDQVFFLPLVAMVNPIIWVPLIGLFRSLCMSVDQTNSKHIFWNWKLWISQTVTIQSLVSLCLVSNSKFWKPVLCRVLLVQSESC